MIYSLVSNDLFLNMINKPYAFCLIIEKRKIWSSLIKI